MLGYNYPLNGKVVVGQQIGSTIGFPTANLDISTQSKLIPAEGIYAVNVFYGEFGELALRGMLYIGRKPTIGTDDELVIEVHIFDFDQILYGEELKMEILSFIREDRKMDSLEALTEQLKADEKDVKHYFTSLDQKKAIGLDKC